MRKVEGEGTGPVAAVVWAACGTRWVGREAASLVRVRGRGSSASLRDGPAVAAVGLFVVPT